MTYLKDIATKLSFSLGFSVIVMLWFSTASTVAGQQDGPLVSDDVKTIDFVTDVQPILQRSCLIYLHPSPGHKSCHRPLSTGRSNHCERWLPGSLIFTSWLQATSAMALAAYGAIL